MLRSIYFKWTVSIYLLKLIFVCTVQRLNRKGYERMLTTLINSTKQARNVGRMTNRCYIFPPKKKKTDQTTSMHVERGLAYKFERFSRFDGFESSLTAFESACMHFPFPLRPSPLLHPYGSNRTQWWWWWWWQQGSAMMMMMMDLA